jgi:hypothetical protein
VQQPAAQVAYIAARPDVVSVTPNRVTSRTASTLEAVTVVLTTGVRTSSSKTSYSGLDGTGIGIAVLDSGIMKEKSGFANLNTAISEDAAPMGEDCGRGSAQRRS